MNKNAFRLIFSVVRGMLVAVQETAVGHGKGCQGSVDRQRQGATFHPVLWLTVIAASMMGLPVMLERSAHAQTLPIQVDKSAPGARPVVGVAANGVPIVNIAAPNQNGGTSVNNFIQYNVGPSGVVLNNSGQNSQTQIAGWVQGNMQLGNNSAGVIVNQVTAPNPSQLMGMQEVAGNRATVVLANPAGITCSGCGVINADRFTLSTSRALYGADGNLSGFDVRDGHIAIDGQGLSSPQAQVDLLARSIAINAELWAKHLNAIAGANQVEYENLTATAQAGNGAAPQFAIDASSLGSMFSGAIRLIGTERGVGFNLGGNIAASTGDITLDANGDVRIVPSARLQSQESATVAGTNIDNAGTVTARGGMMATTSGTLTNSGLLSAGGDVLAQARQIINSGTIGAGVDASANVTQAGNANLAADAAIQSSGRILAGADARLSAPTLNLNGGTLVSHGTADLSAAGDIVQQNAHLEGNAVQLTTGGTLDNRNGNIAAGVNGVTVQANAILNQGGYLSSGGLLAVTAVQTLDNTAGTVAGTGGTTIQVAKLDNAGGVISGRQAVTIAGTTLANQQGKIIAGGPLALAGDSLANTGGQVASHGDATLRIGGTLDNTAGFTHAGGMLDVQAQTILNRNTLGGTDAHPLGLEGGMVRVAANAIDNTSGALRADSALTTTAAKLDNSRGEVTSGGTAQLNAVGTINTQGLLAADKSLGVIGTSLTGDGTVQSRGDVALSLKSDFTNTNEIRASHNLTLDTTGDVINAGTIRAGNALDVHGRNLSNAGELYGEVSNHLGADQTLYNAGLIDGGAVRIDAGTTVTNVDRIFGDSISIGAGQQILNDANPATGQGGVIASRTADVNFGAKEMINREHALVYSSQDLNIGAALDANGKATGQADSLINASATIDVARDANISAANVSNLNNHFSTTRTDTGTVTTLTYRLDGSTQDIAASDVILYQVNDGSWAPGANPGFLGDDDKKVMVLPSAQYPFSEFGPPFDWSRSSDGMAGIGDMRPSAGISGFSDLNYLRRPVGLAYYDEFSVSTSNDNGTTTTTTPEAFVYRPGDVIWDKLGVTRPAVAPTAPLAPKSCGTPSCFTQYEADLAAYQTAYQAWRTTNLPLYVELNQKINAFNQDFNARQVKQWWIVNTNTRIQDEVVATTDPAKILVGRDAAFNGAVTNDKSQILVGGDLAISAPVRNRDYDATRIETITGTREWTYIKSHTFSGDDRRYDTYVLDPVKLEVPKTLAAAVSRANIGSIGHDGSAPDRGAGVGTVNSAQTVLRELSLADAVIRQVTPALAMPRNALFHVNPAPDVRYLIETDPRFTSQRQWSSSDFMLTQLGQDPNHVLKRLGDGFYEARLVADAVMLGTGQRFVGDYTDNEAQYIGLMKAGVTFAQQFHLNIGTELTAAQMAALTSDLVWLVEKTVTLPDGSTQTVLVPQVYLMSHVGQLKADGTLIAANNVGIQTTGDVTNTGTILGRQLALVDARDINNLGGTLNGGTLVLNAKQDLNNLAGQITGGSVVGEAGRDINFTSTTATGSSKTGSMTSLAGVSSVNADDATFIAGRDLNANAASIRTTGDLGLSAERDINLGTIRVAQDEHGTLDAKNNYSRSSSADIGSEISSSGKTTVLAGRDVNANAAYVNADGELGVGAGRDINVKAGEASASVHDEHSTQSGGVLSSTSTHSINATAYTDALGSTFSGDTVAMRAKRDVNVEGSGIVATHDLSMRADRNMNIVAAANTETSNTLREKKTSGMFSGGGAGVTFGQQQISQAQKVQTTTHTASQVGSLEGNVSLKAGESYTQTGSAITALQGDVDIRAKKVEINAATDTYRMDQETHFRQSGLTIAVSNPVIAAAMTAGQMAQAQSQTDDPRMKALAGAATGLAARNAYDAVAKDPQAAGGVNISITVGGSMSDSTQTQTSSTASGSEVKAGGNVSIRAEGAGEGSNINVVGSELQAGNDLRLKADNQVNLEAAANTAEQHSSSKSVSGGVGIAVSYGSNGAAFGVTANAAGSRGKADGNDVTWTNSRATAGNALVIESGGDTNVRGAMVSGKQVVADVGGNLNIESLRDTSKYHSKDQSASGSVTVGYGFSGSASVSQQKMDSDFASVGEQSGIRAGSGGYQIDVKGNTDLKGGLIVGGTAEKNSLSTDTLTVSDIENRAHYSASSIGIGGGYSSGGGGDKSGVGVNQGGEASTAGSGSVPGTELPTTGSGGQGFSFAPPTVAGASGDARSTTQSAISDGSITIRNDPGQQALTGKSAAETIAALNRDTPESANSLKPIFNEKEIKARFEIVGALQRESGVFLNNRANEAEAAKQAADAAAKDPNATPEQRAALQQHADDLAKWGQGGSYRQVMTALTVAASGNVTGSTAQFVQNAAVGYLQGLAASQVKLIADGLGSESARAALHAIVGCAGAAAASQSCGAGAMGAASASVLGSLLGPTEGMTAQQKQARENAVQSLVAGVAGMTAGNPATAVNGATVEIENNQLAPVNNAPLSGSATPQEPFQTPGKPADPATATLTGTPDQSKENQSKPFFQPLQEIIDGVKETTKPIFMPISEAANNATDSILAMAGWTRGRDVYEPTANDNDPSWSAVRSRFWKNEASAPDAPQKYGAENIDRMNRGLAPQRYNPDKGGMESMELSHEPIPARDGGTTFVPRWPQDHATVDPYRRPGY